ncbi:hypothetical protein [Leptospira kirschneri]|uniref:Uncharacterized protein n=2 Tax=Leptospira kirschneri TaxID=29507 RepID=A0A0E2AYA4_9LEPT|nr:hypothetical protein [Leptospira kirschneri]EKO13914.1 hypothetical protein LEP1GSC081_0281 [Leptospira kirschneri str. H1]EMK23929.1 hypothetical protein LEP1GSC008_1070 [Leptospira kirschneri serovar Bulgarica str. Nikolaevo]
MNRGDKFTFKARIQTQYSQVCDKKLLSCWIWIFVINIIPSVMNKRMSIESISDIL